MTSPVFLAVDAGTSRMKAALLDAAGQPLALEVMDIPAVHPFEGASEADMEFTWSALCALTGQLSARCPSAWGRLAGVCVSGQGDGCWPIDDLGRPVRTALLWNDTRTRQLDLEVGTQLEACCLQHSQTQLFPGAAPLQLAWLKKFDPAHYQPIRWVLHCKDWINYCLTGKVCTDPSDASTSLLNVRTLAYETDLLDLLGIPESAVFFPPVVGSGCSVGVVTDRAASQTRLPAGLPVVQGGIDVAVVAAGAGALAPGDALTILGTTLCNEVVIREDQLDLRDTRGSHLRHVVPDTFLRVMATSSGTSSLDWARSTLLPSASFAELESAAAVVPAGSEGVLFQPYLFGERAPFRNASAAGGFYGLSARHTGAHLLRAVYEGLALSFKDCYRVLPPVERVLVTGGGAQSGFLCQLLADALGKTIQRVNGQELGIAGAGVLARSGLGFQAETPEYQAGTVDCFEPDPKNWQLYEQLYWVSVNLRESLDPYWQSRKSIFP